MAGVICATFIVPTNCDITRDPTRVLEKLVPFAYLDGIATIIEKPADAFKTAYLMDPKPTGEVFPDTASLEKVTMYGLHDAGAFYGLFRPVIWEVALLFTHTKEYKNLENFANIDKIYCTTVLNGDGDLKMSYHAGTNRHYGITTFWIQYKPKE